VRGHFRWWLFWWLLVLRFAARFRYVLLDWNESKAIGEFVLNPSTRPLGQNYEITEADQPVAPILGILDALRSNQWLVLFRNSMEQRTEYYPFRKRELIERLSNQQPYAIASVSLDLPKRGAMALTKRVSWVPWNDDEALQSSRLVLIDEQGGLMGVGVPREEGQSNSAVKAQLEREYEGEELISTVEIPEEREITLRGYLTWSYSSRTESLNP
jgi:hypothetical protein